MLFMELSIKFVYLLKYVFKWKLPGLLYADDLALCDESEEDQKVIVGDFVEVCRRTGLKVSADKIRARGLC